MEITKTIKIPISPLITKKKKDIINSISRRVTYAAQLYLDRIVENNMTKLLNANRYQKEIREITG